MLLLLYFAILGASKYKSSKIKKWALTNQRLNSPLNCPYKISFLGIPKVGDRKERGKSVLTVASYTYNRHHRWCMQAAWTNRLLHSLAGMGAAMVATRVRPKPKLPGKNQEPTRNKVPGSGSRFLKF